MLQPNKSSDFLETHLGGGDALLGLVPDPVEEVPVLVRLLLQGPLVCEAHLLSLQLQGRCREVKCPFSCHWDWGTIHPFLFKNIVCSMQDYDSFSNNR